MQDALDIGEVAQRTGLTLRGLRFYEARGLIKPLRTASGRRIYGTREMAQLHAVVALKRVGFSLTQIRALLDGHRIDLATLLTAQIAALDSRAQEVAQSRILLQSVLSRIDRSEPIDVATLCSLIRNGDSSMNEENWKQAVKAMFTPEQRAHWADAAEQIPGGKEAFITPWETLKSRIAARLPLDPASDEAQALLDEFLTLTRPITEAATPEMRAYARRVGEEMSGWDEGRQLPSDSVLGFIKAAHQARQHTD